MSELHVNLNILLQMPVKKLKNKSSQPKVQDVLLEGKYVWTVPEMLLLFLQNTIEAFLPSFEVKSGTDDVSPLSPSSAPLTSPVSVKEK